MNKFSDGFSDNSYEDLLNEYAGDSLGSNQAKKSEVKKPETPKVKKTAPVKTAPTKKAPVKETAKKSTAEPVFNIDISKKNRIDNNDYGLIKSFEEENEEIRSSSPASTTMKFKKMSGKSAPQPVIEKKYVAQKQSLNDRLNSVKKSAYNKVYNNNNQAKSKKKFDFNALLVKLIDSFQNNKKAYIVFGCCLLIAFIVSGVALSCINDVLAINRDDEKIVEVMLPNDADTADAVRVLDKAGLINNSIFCNLYLKVMGYSNDNYLPGVYYFTENMGVEKMITRFKTSTTRGAVISVTIPEGYTIDQIFNRLEKNEICSASSLYKTIEGIDFSSEYDFVAKIENKEDRYHALEGYFFPATYEFEQGADPATVIREFLDAFEKRWSEEYAEQAEALGKTTDEIIRIASIIEKEGADKEQFSLVSSVLHNRLNRSGLYPTLDCDSTKDYVTNTISKRVTSPSKINAYILAYSTYERAGLPAGSICNPGVHAIEAALHPDSTQYYFFAHDNNKKIYMAKTIEEHNANRRTIEKVNAEED